MELAPMKICWPLIGIMTLGFQKIVLNDTDGLAFKSCLYKFNYYPQEVRPLKLLQTKLLVYQNKLKMNGQ